MPGLTVNEGLSYDGKVLYKGATQEDLTIGLYVNAAGTLILTSVWTDVTQPAGAGYAEIALVKATFVVSAIGVVTYPQQQWTAGDNWTGGDIQGYYIRNNNATPVLVHVQDRDAGGFSMLNGRIYTVDLSIDSS